MTKLTNLDHRYTVEMGDKEWKDIDNLELLFVSYVEGTLRVEMRDPWAAPSMGGSWRSYRITAE